VVYVLFILFGIVFAYGVQEVLRKKNIACEREYRTMKLIIAYIQPERLNSVKQALYKKEIFKLSVTNALGCGQQKGYHESYRGVDVEVNLLKKIRLEIAVNADFVEPTIDAIIEGARSGNIGDGKIFILDLAECIRIRTGERGNEAVG
jgi:nitrogen regulatory protein P-II 1